MRAQRGAGRPSDVVGPGLQPVELLDDDERDDDVDVVERDDARRIGDQHRGVEHDPGSAAVPTRSGAHLRSRSRPPGGDRSTPLLGGSSGRCRLVRWVRVRTAGEVPNGTCCSAVRALRAWMTARIHGTSRYVTPCAFHAGVPVLRDRRRRSPTPRWCSATTSRSASSTARRCSRATSLVVPRRARRDAARARPTSDRSSSASSASPAVLPTRSARRARSSPTTTSSARASPTSTSTSCRARRATACAASSGRARSTRQGEAAEVATDASRGARDDG